MESQSPTRLRGGLRSRPSATQTRLVGELTRLRRESVTATNRRVSMSVQSAQSTTNAPVTRRSTTANRRSTISNENPFSVTVVAAVSATGLTSRVSTGRTTRSTTSVSTSTSSAPVSTTTNGRNTQGGSRAQTTRRRPAVEVLPTVQERSSVASPRIQVVCGEPATGCRGRCTRNVHVDKEVQTENRNDGVSVSLNALKRRRQSSSPPTSLPCPICFNEMHPHSGRSVISLRCGHVFCSECIEKSFERCKFCPLCMEPILKRQFRKIYL